MFAVAAKMLLYDKLKTLATLLGVVFAVTLIFAQLGIWTGMLEASSTIIDHTPGDIWITSRNSRNFDFSQPFPEHLYYQVLSVPGIEWAERLIIGWATIKEKEGGTEQVEVIGYNPDTGVGGPWKMKVGNPSAVKNGNFAIVDESAMKKLGHVEVGEYRDVVSRHLQIVGISTGARAFTTAPFVFTSYQLAQQLSSWIGPENTVFVIAKVAHGHSVPGVIANLKARLSGVDVYSAGEFSDKTRHYWTFETGMGFSFLLTVCISFFIGMLIVGQTLYNSTVEYMKEYGTLMALGASNTDVYKIVLSLAFLSAVIGFPISLLFTIIASKIVGSVGMVLVIKWWLNLVMLLIALLMCLLSAVVSINKINHIDPAILFVG